MRETVETYPKSGLAHAILGSLLGEAGFSAEAARHFECATELEPDLDAAWSGLATHRKFSNEDAPLIARMKAGLERPHVSPRCRRALHFALGKACDDVGDYEAAMQNFEAGNRLRTGRRGLNRTAFAGRIDRLIEGRPPGFFDCQPTPGVEDATPILIVGMPRSGTTLTEQILSSHPEVAA